MIDSIKQIVTLKAEMLPPTFDIRIGNREIPMEVESMDAHYVYLRSGGETIYIPRDEMMTVLVPDTWENARMDIELDLMVQGIL